MTQSSGAGSSPPNTRLGAPKQQSYCLRCPSLPSSPRVFRALSVGVLSSCRERVGKKPRTHGIVPAPTNGSFTMQGRKKDLQDLTRTWNKLRAWGHGLSSSYITNDGHHLMDRKPDRFRAPRCPAFRSSRPGFAGPSLSASPRVPTCVPRSAFVRICWSPWHSEERKHPPRRPARCVKEPCFCD